MISKTEEKFVVEGPIYNGHSIEARRIEISFDSGLIKNVSSPRGDANLMVDDDQIIFPGMIDVHIHAREDASQVQNYKETFRSAGEAAIHGGVVGIIEMPNNKIAPIDDETYRQKRELAKNSAIEILLYAGIGPKTRPLSFPVPYKAYMGPSIGDLFFKDDEELRDAIAHYREKWVSFHAEDPVLLEKYKGAPSHVESRPPEAEAKAVEFVVELVKEFGIRANVCHLSTRKGLETILKARDQGYEITCEATPHHLAFDQELISTFPNPGFFQCNPPIRFRDDRIAIFEAYKAGEIDFLATDHAPHTLEENERGISGMPHLDHYGAFIFWLRDQGVSWEIIHKTACLNPGKFFSEYSPDRYGRIEPGFVGSLTVLNPNLGQTVRRSSVRSNAGWSPFEGYEFSGSVTHTIVRGRHYQIRQE